MTLVDPHGVERDFTATPISQDLGHEALLPIFYTDPRGRIAYTNSRADHVPRSFWIIEHMSRLRLVTDRFSVQRTTETPAFDLPIYPIAQTNKIVAGQI